MTIQQEPQKAALVPPMLPGQTDILENAQEIIADVLLPTASHSCGNLEQGEPMPFTKILLASDGSEGALLAARKAAGLARLCGASVVLLNVFDALQHPASVAGLVGVMVDDVIIRGVQRAETAEALVCLDQADVDYRVCTSVGNPAKEILRTAEENDCDLIVLGSRGLGSVKAFLLGSVSDAVTHHAHCPVLIVR